MTAFADRVRDVPTLGLGNSTEYGAAAAPSALDPLTLRATYPAFAAFLEIGVEVSKGLDDTARRWVHEGFPTTYHFLDLNLEDEEDFDAPWLTAAARLAAQIQPAWVCGDAGLWHFGRRERGHMLLLPPVLSAEAARQQAAESSVCATRWATKSARKSAWPDLPWIVASIGLLCRCGGTRRYGIRARLCPSGHVSTAHGLPAVYGPSRVSPGAHCGTARGRDYS